jgi:hypothetical protein
MHVLARDIFVETDLVGIIPRCRERTGSARTS